MTARRDEIARSIGDGIVRCAIGLEQYALRSGDVRHITRAEQLQAGAGPDGRVGTIRVGDETVPVFALGRVLRRPQSGSDDGHHIAVTGEPGALVGWLVDRIVRMALPDSTHVVALPAVLGTRATTWFEALIAVGDESVLLLSPALMNPLAPAFERAEPGEVFVAPAAAGGSVPEPMVVIFSSPALRLAPEALAQDRRSELAPDVDPSRVTRYALSGRQIAAIVQPLPVIAIPGSARHVKGVAWWRQAIVPVIDFRNGSGEHSPCPRWIVAQSSHRPAESLVALPIDSDVRLHRASADDRRIERDGGLFARGVYSINNEPVALLDLEALTSPVGERALA
jgi:chemotaxis signal transduction protein